MAPSDLFVPGVSISNQRSTGIPGGESIRNVSPGRRPALLHGRASSLSSRVKRCYRCPKSCFLSLVLFWLRLSGVVGRRELLTRYTTVEAQLLLVALRGEVDTISHLSSGESLESLFGGNLVCYIDDKDCFSQYSATSSAVGIKRLATTATAAAASGANIVDPALNGIQMDGFTGRRRPSCTIDDLADVDVSLLSF